MTPTELKTIRQRHSLTQADMARILRVQDIRTIRRWETGERPVSGPASILYELLDQGIWRSIDAALTLVPEGCDFMVGRFDNVVGGERPCASVFWSEGELAGEAQADATTPALALCIAADTNVSNPASQHSDRHLRK